MVSKNFVQSNDCESPDSANHGSWQNKENVDAIEWGYGMSYGNAIEYKADGVENGWAIQGHNSYWTHTTDSCSLWFDTEKHYPYSYITIGGMANKNTVKGIEYSLTILYRLYMYIIFCIAAIFLLADCM